MKNPIKLALLLIGVCAASAMVRAQGFPSLDSMTGVSSVDEAAALSASQNAIPPDLQASVDQEAALTVIAIEVIIIIEVIYPEETEFMNHIDFTPEINGNMADIYDYPDDQGGWASGCC